MQTRTSSRFVGRDMGQGTTHGNQRKLRVVVTSWRPSGTKGVSILMLIWEVIIVTTKMLLVM